MGAFDTVIEQKIHSEEWDDNEWVVIREMTYIESVQHEQRPMLNMTIAQSQDKELQEKVKIGDMDVIGQVLEKMVICIKEWSFTQNGKPAPVNRETISKLPKKYGEFIAEKIEELNPTRGADFQGDSEGDIPE